MKREVELQRRLRSLSALSEAVGAMKSLSAHHFRDVRGAVEPARAYREGVERILHRASATLEAGDGPAGLLVVGADLGLCGGYNAGMAEAGGARRTELGPGPTSCVGHRTARLLARRGVEIEKRYAVPTSVHGLTDLLLRLSEDLLTAYAARRLSSLEIVSSRFVGVGVGSPTCTRLLPLEPPVTAETEVRRIGYVDREPFASAAIREFLYVTIHGLLLDALACEHGARLVATQSAERWLDGRTERLRRHLAATRREASTQEVIEITGGGRASRGFPPSREHVPRADNVEPCRRDPTPGG